MENEQEAASDKEAPKVKVKKEAASEKEAKIPEFTGDVNAYISDKGAKEKNQNGTWENLAKVAKQYGRQFIFDDKKVHVNTIPADQLRQFITIAEAYRNGQLY